MFEIPREEIERENRIREWKEAVIAKKVEEITKQIRKVTSEVIFDFPPEKQSEDTITMTVTVPSPAVVVTFDLGDI